MSELPKNHSEIVTQSPVYEVTASDEQLAQLAEVQQYILGGTLTAVADGTETHQLWGRSWEDKKYVYSGTFDPEAAKSVLTKRSKSESNSYEQLMFKPEFEGLSIMAASWNAGDHERATKGVYLYNTIWNHKGSIHYTDSVTNNEKRVQINAVEKIMADQGAPPPLHELIRDMAIEVTHKRLAALLPEFQNRPGKIRNAAKAVRKLAIRGQHIPSASQ